jgi:glyceraldehyde 3-phosphate dehydrogenase
MSLATEILNSNVCPARIDIGKLAFEWYQEQNNYKNKLEFINDKLKGLTDKKSTITPKDVV